MKQLDGGLSFAPDLNARLSKAINRLIDEALEAETAAQTPRDYLGGSRMGVECLRALGYEHFDNQMAAAQVKALRALEGGSDDADAFLAKRGTKFKGKTLRRFRMGHIHEAETARWLKAAGFDLWTETRDGKQFGWSLRVPVPEHPEAEPLKLGGSIDGVFADGPADLGGVKLAYPCLFEHKIMKASKWKEFADKGARASHPVYVAQCQIYMDRMELRQAVLCGLNTDTSELHFEVIDYDAGEAQRILERGVQVVTAAHPKALPRLFGTTPSDFRCRFCDWHSECWSRDADPPKQADERPPWA